MIINGNDDDDDNDDNNNNNDDDDDDDYIIIPHLSIDCLFIFIYTIISFNFLLHIYSNYKIEERPFINSSCDDRSVTIID